MTRNFQSPDPPTQRLGESAAWGREFALIQVPDVSRFRPRPIRAEAWSGDFVARRLSRKPRRRLRKEIRVAAYACLAVLPFVVAAGVWSVHSTARRAGAAEIERTSPDSVAQAPAHPQVWLSLEPIGASLDAEPEPPVVFPGYLLPADRREELSHEGG